MKKFQTLLLAFSIALLVACGADKQEESQLQTVTHEPMGITLEYPEGWIVKNEEFGIAITDLPEINFTSNLQSVQQGLDGTTIILWSESFKGMTDSILSMSPAGVEPLMISLLADTFNGKAADATETTWLGLEGYTAKEIVVLNEQEFETTYFMADDLENEILYYIIALDSTQENDELIQQIADSATLK